MQHWLECWQTGAKPLPERMVTIFQGSYWVWTQPMRDDVTLWRRLSLAEPIPRRIPVFIDGCTICVTHVLYAPLKWVTISAGNGLWPCPRQAITPANAQLFPTGPLGTNFDELNQNTTFRLKKWIWKSYLQNIGHFVSVSRCLIQTKMKSMSQVKIAVIKGETRRTSRRCNRILAWQREFMDIREGKSFHIYCGFIVGLGSKR